MTNINELLRRLPSVEILSTHPALEHASALYSQPLVVDAVRQVLDGVRSAIMAGNDQPPDNEIIDSILALLPARFGEHLRGVINGTGVLVHTNLGRTPLAEQTAAPQGYSNLEFDLPLGKRGKRGRLIESMIGRLAKAEAALIVNNNAAAVYLVLSGLAVGREVIISRGELVQIGGGFRIPDILARSGAVLCEVGTTNKTDVEDYAKAINDKTALILKVHHSNFKVTGFVAEAGLRELSALGKEYDIPVIMDLGSGAVSDLRPYGLPHEPTLSDCVNEGVDLVTASGDKLFGGPQAGLIAGKKDFVERLRKDPFYRALRPDKTALAGLEFTARAHLDGAAEQRLPLYRMLAEKMEHLKDRTEAVINALKEHEIECRPQFTEATVGGGSLPQEMFPSLGFEIHSGLKAESLAAKLRSYDPPVVGVIVEDKLRFDMRTVFTEQHDVLIEAIVRAHQELQTKNSG